MKNIQIYVFPSKHPYSKQIHKVKWIYNHHVYNHIHIYINIADTHYTQQNTQTIQKFAF